MGVEVEGENCRNFQNAVAWVFFLCDGFLCCQAVIGVSYFHDPEAVVLASQQFSLPEQPRNVYRTEWIECEANDASPNGERRQTRLNYNELGRLECVREILNQFAIV